MGSVEGKTAFITGAARGMGRSHAVRLAAEGADIVAVDLCADVMEAGYPLATPEDLAETATLVEKQGRRVITHEADVRELDQLQQAADDALGQLGHIDIVIANAGISGLTTNYDDEWLSRVWQAVIDVNLTGVWNTVRACAPSMIGRGEGGAIVLISSTAGLRGLSVPGVIGDEAYTASKHGVVGLMRAFAVSLAEYRIRVNSIHPTGVRTPMVENESMAAFMEKFPGSVGSLTNLLPVEMLDPADISEAVLFLVSDAARYVTGVTFPVDAGFTAK